MVALLVCSVGASALVAQEGPATGTYADIEQTLGFVPEFLRAFPEEGIAGAWAEMKTIQMNPASALDGKTKELLGLAVAAQIPCEYCIYFHTAAARANGATEAEIREAVAMAAIVRHWSTFLNGMQIDAATFRREVDTIMSAAAGSSE
jgi:AhpD family alkylhydroperoxidase